MKLFYSIICYSILLLSGSVCFGMTAQEIADLHMEKRLLACYQGVAVVKELNNLAVIMRSNNEAALSKSRVKACEYEDGCSDKSAIKSTLLAGHDGAHAGLEAYKEAMQNLPGNMMEFLRDKFQKLRAILLSSDNVETVNDMVENIKIYDQLTQQLIENLKVDLEHT